MSEIKMYICKTCGGKQLTSGPPGLLHSSFEDGEICSGQWEEKTHERIMAQREEILAAFIAKYGCDPDEVMQITTVNAERIEWTIKRKDESK